MSVSSRFASSLRAHPLAGFVSALAAGAVLGGTAMHMLAQKMHGRCPVVEGGAAHKKKPLVVTVTGAGGQIGYAIIFQIAAGRMLGPDQPIELRLLEIAPALPLLSATVMELEDCAFPLVTKVVPTADVNVAFQDCDIALLIGARPRGPGMTRADLLKANASIFKDQGRALNDFASPNVKVLVVGNPANTNAKIAMENAPNLPRTAFTAMTRLDEIRATAQIAKKADVSVGDVKNVVVWGNHSETQVPDLTFASIRRSAALAAIGNDETWSHNEFISTVQQRGGAIIKASGKSSAASAANAAIEHVKAWHLGTAPGQWVSMAVCSNGEYGVPKGLIYSFPCTCSNGSWSIVPGLEGQLTPFIKEKMKISWEQLQAEWNDGSAATAGSGSAASSSSSDSNPTPSEASYKDAQKKSQTHGHNPK